jgi:hypothetical protein
MQHLTPTSYTHTTLPPPLRPPAVPGAFAAAAQAPTFPTFFAGLVATPNTNYGRRIIDTLKLQTTLSNPALALTVFMPEDQVGCPAA